MLRESIIINGLSPSCISRSIDFTISVPVLKVMSTLLFNDVNVDGAPVYVSSETGNVTFDAGLITLTSLSS